MSIKLMSLVWDMDLSTFEKLVMLALADCANDEGECWPSIATLVRKTGAGERTVQRSIRALESAGFLKRVEVIGKGNRYFVTPATAAPRQTDAPPEKAKTPATAAPKPSGTIINGLADAKPIRAIKRKGWPTIPAWIPAEPWNGFIQMRDGKRASPTARAVSLILAKLERLKAKGHDPGEILDVSTEHSWTGLFEPKAPQDGQSSRISRLPQPTDGRGSRPDPCLDMLRAATAAERFPGDHAADFAAWPALPAIGTG